MLLLAILFTWAGVVYTIVFDWDTYGLFMSAIGVTLLIAFIWRRIRQ